MQSVSCAASRLAPAVGRAQRSGARSTEPRRLVVRRAEPRADFDPESQDTLGVGTLLDRDLGKL